MDDTNDTDFDTNDTILDTNTYSDKKNDSQILQLLANASRITLKELSIKSSIPIATTKRMVKRLITEGKLERVGNNRTGHWHVK